MIILSYIVAFIIGIMALAPRIPFEIPLTVHSNFNYPFATGTYAPFNWLYVVIISLVLGMYLLTLEISKPLKLIAVYLFIACFFSMIPTISFGAYLLVVITMYFLIAVKKSDTKIILNMACVIFLAQMILGLMQLAGKNTLMEFGGAIETGKDGHLFLNTSNAGHKVFMGSIMQPMQFGAFLGCLAPLLLLNKRWYIFLLIPVCIITHSSSFAMALAAGAFIYFVLTAKKYRWWIVGATVLMAAGYLWYDQDSVLTAFTCGRIGVWRDIAFTCVFNTTRSIPGHLSGPFDPIAFFFGHGMQTFNPLFPFFKLDTNPFPWAHNDLLEIPWEVGAIGMSLFIAYVSSLIYRLKKRKLHLEIACVVSDLVLLMFTFVIEMTSSVLLLVTLAGICEKRIAEANHGNR